MHRFLLWFAAIAVAGADNDKPAHAHHAFVKCSESVNKHCCGDSICAGSEDQNNCLEDCPGVTTQPMCGEEPHSDRGGRTLQFGVGHRAGSAQECCDKCLAHAKSGRQPPCNSWTFCGYPGTNTVANAGDCLWPLTCCVNISLPFALSHSLLGSGHWVEPHLRRYAHESGW